MLFFPLLLSLLYNGEVKALYMRQSVCVVGFFRCAKATCESEINKQNAF